MSRHLPTWEQDLLLHATEKPSTIPLYELLNQKHLTLLAISDGGADVPRNYGSFGWVLGTEHEILWECKGIARGYPMQSYREEGYGRLSLLSVLTHYMLYLEIQTSEDLCITSYCDNHSLLKKEETFHTRDIDSSSWYTNPDHDVSVLRTKLIFRRHRYTFALIETDTANSTFFHDLHNSMFLPTNSLSKYSRTSKQRTNLPSSTHYPHAASTYVMAQGTSQAAKKVTHERIPCVRNAWTAHILDSINWTAYRAAISALTDQVRTFVIKLNHDWLPVGVWEHRYGAATDTCPKCIQLEIVRHLYLCHSS
jgi:hypothetical protein